MSKIKAIIFDFDGVMVESIDCKTRAFAFLFKDYPEQANQIVEYHLLHGGISRFEKFGWIYDNILHLPLSEDEKTKLGRQFADFVYQEVINCPFVKGAYEFLNNYYQKISMFIVSGTPDGEIKAIVEERGLKKYFMGVFGAPSKKHELNSKIIKNYEFDREEIIYVGDSLDDYEGARKSGIEFIGRISQTNPFKKKNVLAVVHDLFELDDFINKGMIRK